jgi:hypothetical protein
MLKNIIRKIDLKAIGQYKKDELIRSATNASGIVMGGKVKTIQKYANQYTQIKREYKKGVFDIVDKFRGGKLSRSEASRQFGKLSRKMYDDAFFVGTKFSGNIFYGTEHSLLDKDLIFTDASARAEKNFFNSFLKDIEKYPENIDPDGVRRLMDFETRKKAYVDSLDGMFNSGYVRGLPDDLPVIWIVNPSVENCPDCLDMAAAKWTVATLPFVPRSGNTRCLWRCHCHLEVVGQEETGVFPIEREMPATRAKIYQKPDTTAGRGKLLDLGQNKEIYNKVDDIVGRMNYHRQMSYLVDDDTLKKNHIAARKELNKQLIDIQTTRGITINPTLAVRDDLIHAVDQMQKAGYSVIENPFAVFNAGDSFSVVTGKTIDHGIVSSISSKSGVVVGDMALSGSVRYEYEKTVFFKEPENG